MFKISEKSNGRIIEKWLRSLLSHPVYRNRSLNFTPAFYRRFKDLEPMLEGITRFIQVNLSSKFSVSVARGNSSSFAEAEISHMPKTER